MTAVIMCLSVLGKSKQPPNPGAILRDTLVSANISLPKKKTLQLSPSEIDGVEKFVLFIGNGRSGTSIFGSMMDAHPNVIISNEFLLFRKWFKNPSMSKIQLFNDVYASSRGPRNKKECRSSTLRLRTRESKKGYSLGVPSQWKGCFTELKIIGDKCAADVADLFNYDTARAKKALLELQSMINIPIVFIQVVRNPFDSIATMSLHGNYTYIKMHRWDESISNQVLHKKSPQNLSKQVQKFFRRSSITWRLRQEWNLTLLEIHYPDFIKDPVAVLKRMCKFLEVDCPADYLESCREKTFQSISKTRHLIEWPPDLMLKVKEKMRTYPFYQRYSFEED